MRSFVLKEVKVTYYWARAAADQGHGMAPPATTTAGKQGRIAIFSTAGAAAATSKSPEGEGARGLLMSYRGHGGTSASLGYVEIYTYIYMCV